MKVTWRVTWKDNVQLMQDKSIDMELQRRLQNVVAEMRFRFVEHVLRMASERLAHCIGMDWTPADGENGDRSKKTWQSTYLEELQATGVS